MICIFPPKINRRASREMSINDGPRAVKLQLIKRFWRDSIYLSHWIGGEHFTGGAEKKLRTEAAPANQRYLAVKNEQIRGDPKKQGEDDRRMLQIANKEIAFPYYITYLVVLFGITCLGVRW